MACTCTLGSAPAWKPAAAGLRSSTGSPCERFISTTSVDWPAGTCAAPKVRRCSVLGLDGPHHELSSTFLVGTGSVTS